MYILYIQLLTLYSYRKKKLGSYSKIIIKSDKILTWELGLNTWQKMMAFSPQKKKKKENDGFFPFHVYIVYVTISSWKI